MKGFLLDTNVLSELRRSQCAPSVAAFADTQPRDLLFTSVINIAEIRFGRNRAPTADKQREIDTWLQNVLRPWFAGRLLPATEDVFVLWREIVERARQRNYTFPEPDTLIGAIAQLHEMITVTRDVRPSTEAGVPVLDPWTAQFVSADGHVRQSVPLDSPNLLQFLVTA